MKVEIQTPYIRFIENNRLKGQFRMSVMLNELS